MNNNIIERPRLIVLTPVRNEAWILKAYLAATSLWADYIIIADQNSTDGSREICEQFEKVIFVSNDEPIMHMANARRILFDEANKIPGPKILFTLDADEFLYGDFQNTTGWSQIMQSQPGDVFCWRWMNVHKDKKHYSLGPSYYWAANIGESLFEGIFPDNHIHEWRLPWPHELHKEYILDDLFSIHLARVATSRQHNKSIFYQVSTVYMDNKVSAISLYRQYHNTKENPFLLLLPDDTYSLYSRNGIDVLNMIDFDNSGDYYIQETLRMVKESPVLYRKLAIWEESCIKAEGIPVQRRFIDKIIQLYLRSTSLISKKLIIRAIDKTLKILGY